MKQTRQQRLTVGPVNDMPFKQSAVIEFRVAEKESVRNFHKCLCIVYGSAAAVDTSTAGHWVQKVMATEQQDFLRSGRPFVAVRPEVLQRDDVIVREDGSITTRQLALILSVSKGSVSRIIRDL